MDDEHMFEEHPHRRRLAMFTPLRRRATVGRRRFRRGVYLLPSAFTLANLFCGYACVVYSMRGEYETAAPLIGVAVLLDMLDGRIARMTGTATEFGLQFDSLADVVSFGIAPAILAFSWGLEPLHRIGWMAGFIFVTAAAMRLARFNIQSGSVDKRYFVGMPSPAAAGIVASTVYFYPAKFDDPRQYLVALVVMLVPAFMMVSTIRFRSFKNLDLQARRSYKVLALLALVIAVIVAYPKIVLLLVCYLYLLSAIVELLYTRLRRREQPPQGGTTAEAQPTVEPERKAKG